MKQVAVVDLGTNAMRLAVGQGQAGRYDLLHYVRFPNRLSEGMFADGMLQQQPVDRTLQALADIQAALRTFKVDALRLISTSVLRTAKNADYFVDLVRKQTGFSIEIISGSEEARLIHTGAVNGIDTGGKRAFVIDIGGGSTELSVGNADTIEFAVSIESGAVRLKEWFFHHDPPFPDELAGIQKAIDHDFAGALNQVRELKPQMQVGVPGNIGTIYNTVKPKDGLMMQDLESLYTRLTSLTVPEIKTFTGLEPDKADILLPGLMILMKIMDVTSLQRCYVSQKGLLHGLMIDLFSR